MRLPEEEAEEEAEELDDQYFDLVPQDSVLVEAFLQKRAASPEAFAPVEGEGHV